VRELGLEDLERFEQFESEDMTVPMGMDVIGAISG